MIIVIPLSLFSSSRSTMMMNRVGNKRLNKNRQIKEEKKAYVQETMDEQTYHLVTSSNQSCKKDCVRVHY